MEKKLNHMIGLGLMISLVLGGWGLIFPNHSHAAVNCGSAGSGDFDLDGFSDTVECTGFTTFGGAAGLVVPSCTASDLGDQAQRATCMDPNSKDLFVVLRLTPSGSNIETFLVNEGIDPLAVLRKTLQQGGLGIVVHQLNPQQIASLSSRQVTAVSPQKAILISESLSTSSPITGVCSQGTPNQRDNCGILSQNIVNLITSKCAGKTCALSPGGNSTVNTVIATYMQNTLSHEASHTLSLAPTYNSNFGGNHYQTGTNVVMDQSVYYTVTGSTVTFFLPNVYAGADPGLAKLK